MHFSDIPVQESLKHLLQQALEEGRQPHATLYAGPVGCAALPLALAVARALLCTEGKAACGKCNSCGAMDKCQHPDLHFFFPAVKIGTSESKQEAARASYQLAWRKFVQQHPYGGLQRWRLLMQQSPDLSASAQKNLLISRDEVRRLLATSSFTPYMSPVSVICVWLPERLHHIAANALLKTLEDPSSRSIFLVVSHDSQQLLPTLRSRMQRIQVPPFSSAQLSNYLQSTHKLKEEQSIQIASRVGGDLDQAQQLATSPEETNTELLQNWLRACWLHKADRILAVSETFAKQPRLSQQVFLKESLYFFRQVLLQKAKALRLAPPSAQLRTFVENFSGSVSYGMLQAFVSSSNSMLNHLEQNAHAKMLFLSHSLRLSDALAVERRALL